MTTRARAITPSQRERVAPKTTAEGRSGAEIGAAAPLRWCLDVDATSPHPAAARPPSPFGRRHFVCVSGFEARERGAWVSRPRDIERAPDLRQDPVEPFLDLVVGEAEFEKTISLDRLAPVRIGQRLVRVVRAVELDREPRVGTAEINDEAADRRLPSELPAAETAATQFAPEDVLGTGALSTRAAGERSPTERHDPHRNSLTSATSTLSQRERVSPKATGEGRSGAEQGAAVPLLSWGSDLDATTPHPATARPPSPYGRRRVDATAPHPAAEPVLGLAEGKTPGRPPSPHRRRYSEVLS
jgi:hypothetical protein